MKEWGSSEISYPLSVSFRREINRCAFYYTGSEDIRPEFIVVFNRRGPVGTVKMEYDEEVCQYHETDLQPPVEKGS